MAFIASHATAPDQPSMFARLLAGFRDSLLHYGEVRSHYAEIEMLNRKSDEELARLGLTREGIVRHVFSDSFYL